MNKNKMNDPEYQIGENEAEGLGWSGVAMMAAVFIILIVGMLILDALPAFLKWLKAFARRCVWHRYCAWGQHSIQRPLIPLRIFWKQTDGICRDCFKKEVCEEEVPTEGSAGTFHIS